MNYEVVDLVKYNYFDIKFIFRGHHMRKLRSLWCSLSLPVLITTISSHEPAMMIVSLLVHGNNWQ